MKSNLGYLAGAFLALGLFSACSKTGDATDLVADESAEVSLTTSVASVENDSATSAGPADDAMAEADQEALAEDGATAGELFPDVIDAVATQDGDGTWTFSVTMSSPYDSPERYADGWRVIGEDGTEYGIRMLTHDHADEQPFTRSHSGIEIPDEVATVIVEGRDQISGWGGATREVQLTS